MNAAAQRVTAHQPIADEDLARANFYALLARLFYGPPDAALLQSLAQTGELVAEGTDCPLPAAWNELRRAAETGDAEAVRAEYEQLFVGVGESPVSPYALAHFGAASRRPHPLAALREALAQLGLARSPQAREPEDHVAALADVMRHLIVDEKRPAAVRHEAQQEFFARFIEPWYGGFCHSVEASPVSDFYRLTARFARAFLDLERSSFQIDNR